MRIKNSILFLVSFVAIAKFCHWQTAGFSLLKICNSPPTLETASSPPFTFLGSGKQFFAFESPDHTFVIKFLKTHRRKPLPWLANLPLPPPLSSWRDDYLKCRASDLSHLLQSANLAIEQLPFQTALLHLFPLPPSLTLIDKLGIFHTIKLSETIFFLQSKTVPFIDYFTKHLEEAHSLIESYIATVLFQCRQGLCNLDPLIHRNFGVLDHRVIILDIGSFIPHPQLTPVNLKKQLFLELLPLRAWLQAHHPHHLLYFDSCLQKVMNDILRPS